MTVLLNLFKSHVDKRVGRVEQQAADAAWLCVPAQ